MAKYTAGNPDDKPVSKALDPGRYQFEVIEAEEKVAKSGNDMIKLKMEERESKAKVFEHLVFVSAAFWKIDQFRQASGEDVQEGEDVEIIASQLIGRRVIVQIEPEVTNGKTYNAVEYFITPEDWTPEEAAWVLSGMDGSASAPAGDDEEEDEIPF